MNDTTITALSTFAAESAIGIIRVSGIHTFSYVSNIFKFKNSNKTFSSVDSHTIHLGNIFDKKEVVDEVLVSVFKSPSSYTGEDMVEISSHGNPFVLSKIINLCIEAGCVNAEPGEFTKRAFLNGKMDLSEAEAVADVISAKSDTALKLSLNQLKGKEKDAIKMLKSDLTAFLTKLEMEIDFAHEDIPKLDNAKAISSIQTILHTINKFISNADEGMVLKEGIKLVITGKPNTGKSSILNSLLKKDKAIVTAIPGTTRDIIEDTHVIEGLPFRIIDTAGIRESANIIETEGIKRAKNMIEQSVLVLLVLDGSQPLDGDDKAVTKLLTDTKFLTVVNKSDLKQVFTVEQTCALTGSEQDNIIRISTLDPTSINSLTNKIKSTIIDKDFIPVDDIVITSMRHKEALIKAKSSLEHALKSAEDKMSFEFTSADVKDCINAVSEITGDIGSDDILDRIFKNFCIGK